MMKYQNVLNYNQKLLAPLVLIVNLFEKINKQIFSISHLKSVCDCKIPNVIIYSSVIGVFILSMMAVCQSLGHWLMCKLKILNILFIIHLWYAILTMGICILIDNNIIKYIY